MVSTAARVGSINVLLTTQFGGAVTGLNTFARTVEVTGTRAQRAVGGIDRSILGMNRTMRGISGHSAGFRGLMVSALRTRDAIGQLNMVLLATSTLLGGLAPALTGAYFVKMADRAHLVANNLRTVSESTAELKDLTNELFLVSQRSRASFEATSVIYARTARATRHLQMSQADLLRMTETIQKAFAVGGATTQEAWGAAIQLSQGIASDRFSGEEFRSVAENAPVLLTAMANSMGVTIGKLREMAHAGLLTAKTVTQAILNATDEVEEGFARTTSTIGQAMIHLDNALLKYVSDSKNVSAASLTIVGAINAVTENIDTLVSAVILLGSTLVSVMVGRPLNALKQNIAAHGAYLRAVRSSAIEAKRFAEAEARAAATRLASAQAYYRMVTTGVASESTRVRAARDLHRANITNLAVQKELAIATKAHAEALRSASIQGRAFAAVGRFASGAWAFVGGGFGVALMAAAGAIYALSARSAAAQNRIAGINEELQRMGIVAEDAADGLERAGKALNEITADQARSLVRKFEDQIEAITGNRSIWSWIWPTEEDQKNLDFIGDRIRLYATLASEMKLSPVDQEALRQMDEMARKLRTGETTADQVNKELDRIAEADLSEPVDVLIGKLREAASWLGLVMQGSIEAANAFANAATTEKTGRLPGVLMNRAQGEMDEQIRFASRFGWDEFFKFPKEAKARSTRKTADDRFEQSLQAIRDRTAALIEEQNAYSLTYQQQEQRRVALELEQSALKAVREEARRKGEQDWMNASLTAEQIAQIRQVSEEYAVQAERLRQISERQELQRSILKGVFGDLRSALEDGKITLEEFGQIFINILDKIIDKILDDVIDAIMQATEASGGLGGALGQALGIVGAGFGGGGLTRYAAGIQSGAIVGLFHGGGDADSPRRTRTVPLVNPASLPKYHSGKSGIGHKEVMALLEKSETVFTAGQTGRVADALSASLTAMRGDRTFNLNIDVHGAQAELSQTSEGANLRLIPQVVGAVAQDIARGGVIANQLQGQYGLKRRTA